jgi:hypothetical protein
MVKAFGLTEKPTEPIELDDSELAAVAGGGLFDFSNSLNNGNIVNSFNNFFNGLHFGYCLPIMPTL